MKALILAAGRGKRMNHMTENCPKALIEINSKSLLDMQIFALQDAGIEEVAIITGYKNEMLEGKTAMTFHNSRWNQTNMVSSLECAAAWLEGGDCIVSYSDIFYNTAAVLSLVNCNESAAITYDINWRQLWENRFTDPLLDAETFRLSRDGYLLEIGNTPATMEEIEGQYMGLLLFTPIFWQECERIRYSLLQDTRDSMDMTGMLQRVIDEGNLRIRAIPYDGEWGEVDRIEDLQAYAGKYTC